MTQQTSLLHKRAYYTHTPLISYIVDLLYMSYDINTHQIYSILQPPFGLSLLAHPPPSSLLRLSSFLVHEQSLWPPTYCVASIQSAICERANNAIRQHIKLSSVQFLPSMIPE